MDKNCTRREWLLLSPVAVGAGLTAGSVQSAPASAAEPESKEPFTYCLNSSTLMGQKLDLVQVVEIASKAGYQALEPWINEMDRHVKQGGSLKELGRRIHDRGLKVESAIDFFEWIVDDKVRRKKALEQARHSMEMIQQIGGRRIAAPPAGATRQANMDLLKVAERYRALLDIGEQFGVIPQVEVWGFSQTLGRLGEAVLVAMESGHANACVLPDVYHLYKGGSSLSGLKLLNGMGLHVLHMNDYPAKPPRESITDAQRVYPGDGIAPLKLMLRNLREIGFRGVLSLELFNRDYWKQDALQVARTGLEKMRSAVRSSVV